MAKDNNNKQENFEQTLFKAADKLHKNMDATTPVTFVKFFKGHAKL